MPWIQELNKFNAYNEHNFRCQILKKIPKKDMTEQYQRASPIERESLLNIFFVDVFFYGILGTCNTALVGLELKDDPNPV